MPPISPGMVSVIVPCRGQLAFTRACIPALLRHTTAPWELIVVDDGSTDGTAEYALGLADSGRITMQVLRHQEPRGFPAACNAGLAATRGEFLVLLNNDAVVTDGWADQLVALLRSDPTIGLAGPMSNYAAPPQLVPEVPYLNLEGMQGFASRWREERRGQWFTCGKLSGFCLMMKRELYERIGGLDERFGLGFFDDDDLAERARRAGFQLAVAHDLLVHHFGSRTIQGLGIDAGALLRQNRETFAAKWGPDSVAGLREVEIRPWVQSCPSLRDGDLLSCEKSAGREAGPCPNSGNDERERAATAWRDTLEEGRTGGPICRSEDDDKKRPATAWRDTLEEGRRDDSASVPKLLRRQVRVSLTMIVRDEEANLPRCLDSVAGLFDEIVVVDTGSGDRTKELALERGARVFDFPWIDDFAAARNEALARATGDYAFWLDADDVLDPAERAKLERLLATLQPGHACGYVVRCACDPDENGGGGQTVVDHVRLFPLRDDVRWTYRVHEQILPALNRASVPVRWTDLTVRHTGYSDSATRARKLERDEKLLLSELEQSPEEPFVLFNLGLVAVERQDWPKALAYLERSLAGSRPHDSITRKMHAMIARAHQGLEDLGAALAACDLGLASDPDDAELLFRKAVISRARKEPLAAEACWRRVLQLRRPERFSSVDQGIYGHLTRRNLAILAELRGDGEEVRRQWRAVLAECPGDAEALERLQERRGHEHPPSVA